MKTILVADLLCGAGGSSTGCERALAALGMEMELVCVNHWNVAIETHRLNHPKARHVVQDIATVRPRELVPEGRLDLLMASPTCTHHSVARGGRPMSDQQRSDPWHIIAWLTELRVKAIIIENVWEFTTWGPVNSRTGRPVKSRKGEYFMAWIAALKACGFDVEWRKLNAADFGDATTRQRFILMGRSDGKPIKWPMPSHVRSIDGKLSLFPTMKKWRPAREIIDWSIPGKSIYDRKKPLAAATLSRIYAGANKFSWPEPFIVTLRNHMSAQGIDVPLPTITGGGTHIALAQPFILAPGTGGAPRATDDPLPTITTGGAGADDPGCARPMLAEPIIVNGRRNNKAKGVSEAPIPTLDSKGGVWMAEPFVLSRQGEGAPRSIEEPTPTQVAKHSHVLISPYYGEGSGETCHSAEEPLPSVTTKGRFGMVVPVCHTKSNGNRARDVADPIPTLTTAKGGELAMVMPVTHADVSDRVRSADEPIPTVTGANRGELALAVVQTTETYDILFRMLEPHELAAAMGFDGADERYQFAGTKTEKIKQIGNAVSVAKMKACVTALMQDEAVPVERPQRRRATA